MQYYKTYPEINLPHVHSAQTKNMLSAWLTHIIMKNTRDRKNTHYKSHMFDYLPIFP